MQYMCPFWSLRSQLSSGNRSSLGTGHPRHRAPSPSRVRSAISTLARVTRGSPAPAGPAPGGPGNGSGPAAWLWIFELRYEAEAGAERSRVCKLCAPHALRPHCIGGRSRRAPSTHRHALYAWVPPSPRVRCRKAFVTYLLLTGSVKSSGPQTIRRYVGDTGVIQIWRRGWGA